MRPITGSALLLALAFGLATPAAAGARLETTYADPLDGLVELLVYAVHGDRSPRAERPRQDSHDDRFDDDSEARRGYGDHRSHKHRGYAYGEPYRCYRDSYGPPPLPKRKIVRKLRRRHHLHVRKIRYVRGIYKVRARNEYGERLKLVVDPYSGRILRWRYVY
ncbi:MAG: hypothetical protein ACE5H8_07155 [Alphaproteobacteria bacterium]